MSKMERNKGARIEREIVELHRELGVHAEKVPLSGAASYQGAGNDVDVYAFGRDAAAFTCEVKARKSGEGFALLERWLAGNDVLFLRRNRAKPMVVLSWDAYEQLICHTSQSDSPNTRPSSKSGPQEKISAKPATNGSRPERLE
jgi:Holliday junction resolvase